MNILFVGDVVGRPGRKALARLLPVLRDRYDVSFAVVNGENSAGGLGVTRKTAAEMFESGADVVTLGNHSFSKKDALDYCADEPSLLRPENYPPGVPGRGYGIFSSREGIPVAVASLLGRTFMDPVDCPFRTADHIIQEMRLRTAVIVIDFHAEATSEKCALGRYLDGRVSAVIGTHTHVQTSDERVLPSGTAYITDVGMTGATDSILGMDPDTVISRFLTSIGSRFKLADGPASLQAVIIEVDEATGQAAGIKRIAIAEADSQALVDS